MKWITRWIGLGTLCVTIPAMASDGREMIWSAIDDCPSIKTNNCPALETLIKQGTSPLLTVLTGFRSSDQSRRSRAAVIVMRPELGDPAKRCQAMIDTAKTTADSLRGELYGAMGRLKHGCAIPVLTKVVVDPHTDARNRVYAANALGNFPRAEIVEPLVQALNDPAMRVQAAAAHSLGAIGQTAAGPGLINRMLTVITPPSVRIACANALAKLGDQRAIAPLAIMLHHRVAEVRKTATLALGTLRNKAVVPLLVQRLYDPGIQEALVGALVTLGDERGIAPLGALARNESIAKTTRLRALQGLGHWQSAQVHKSIAPLLNHTDPELVVATVTALGQSKTKESIPSLVPLTTSPTSDISNTAVWALEKITSKRLGGDPDAWMRAYPPPAKTEPPPTSRPKGP